ncbi:MAG TPA: hypothetical protein VFL80_12695, partial [Thermoanaerobaculia bacterium]|nr:hypothetical protein [Thermoanaerobaculia bacterium]
FAPDEHLTNATLPTSPPPPPQPVIDDADLPERASVSPARLVAAAVAVVLAGVAIAYRPDAPEDAIDFRVTAREAKEAARRHLLSVSKPPARMQVIAGPTEGFRSWNRESQREEGGAPGGFDDIAAEYVARHSSLQTVIDILRSRLPAAAWAVRFFVPERKEEWFVHVDQKSGKVTGYHRYQEQHARGGSLEREAALAVAAGAFARYGVSQSDFDLAEALVFRQPARRDWLFHFDEKAPLAAAARRRVTIRVAGAELTQFATTIRVPEETYREASGQTIVNVVLLVVKLAATVSLLTLIVTGFVLVAFRRSVNWRRAARWTGMLSIIPILSVLSSYESELFRYSTFMKWETFVTDIAVGTVRDVGLRIGLLFLAIAGATAAVPAAARLLGREGRGRLGAAAVVSSLAATALFLLLDVASLWTAHAFPGRSRFPSLSAPDLVALPLPVMLAIGEALYTAIIGGAAVALFFAAFRKPPGRWTLAVLITAILFGVSLDTAAQPHQIGLMLLSSIVTAVVVYTIGRFMMGANPLAYPLVIFTVTLLQRAAAMLQNDRADLRLNGYAAVAVTIITMIWMAWPQTRADAQEIQKSA